MSTQRFRDHIWPLRDRLYRLAVQVVGERAEAEDVVQETMIKIWEKRDSLDQINNLDAWCARLVRNLGIDRYRSRKRRAQINLDQAATVADAAPSPVGHLQARDLQHQIDHCMQQLPTQRRMVIHLREVEGLSYKEIAQTLEISLDQVRTDIHRGRLFLRNALQEHQCHE